MSKAVFEIILLACNYKTQSREPMCPEAVLVKIPVMRRNVSDSILGRGNSAEIVKSDQKMAHISRAEGLKHTQAALGSRSVLRGR